MIDKINNNLNNHHIDSSQGAPDDGTAPPENNNSNLDSNSSQQLNDQSNQSEANSIKNNNYSGNEDGVDELIIYNQYEDYEDDQRFVGNEGEECSLESASEAIFQDIIADLDEYSDKISGIRPIKAHDRSLSHEHGGLEVKKHDGKSKEDSWDDRSEEINEMAEDTNATLSDSNTSSLRKSFIHNKKQGKKGRRKRREEIEEEMMEHESSLSLLDVRKESKVSHVDKLSAQRSNASRGAFDGIGF
jgi:hypothetical protein